MYTWSILSLERNTSDGGVVVAHWRCDGADGDYKAGAYGSVGFTPDPEAEGFIPFDQLTEADVLEWVYASVDKTEIEGKIAEKIAEDKAPKIEVGVPW